MNSSLGVVVDRGLQRRSASRHGGNVRKSECAGPTASGAVWHGENGCSEPVPPCDLTRPSQFMKNATTFLVAHDSAIHSTVSPGARLGLCRPGEIEPSVMLAFAPGDPSSSVFSMNFVSVALRRGLSCMVHCRSAWRKRAKSNDVFVGGTTILSVAGSSPLFAGLCGPSRQQPTSPVSREKISAAASVGCPANSSHLGSYLPRSCSKSREGIDL